MSPERYVTKCKVCGIEFRAPAVDPNNQALLFRFADRLSKHLNEHKDLIAAVTTVLVLTMYDTEDMMLKASLPAIMAPVDHIRAALHQGTQKFTIPDSMIDSKITELGFEQEDAEGLRALLRDMRDLLTEQGTYAPQRVQTPEKTLVTP